MLLSSVLVMMLPSARFFSATGRCGWTAKDIDPASPVSVRLNCSSAVRRIAPQVSVLLLRTLSIKQSRSGSGRVIP